MRGSETVEERIKELTFEGSSIQSSGINDAIGHRALNAINLICSSDDDATCTTCRISAPAPTLAPCLRSRRRQMFSALGVHLRGVHGRRWGRSCGFWNPALSVCLRASCGHVLVREGDGIEFGRAVAPARVVLQRELGSLASGVHLLPRIVDLGADLEYSPVHLPFTWWPISQMSTCLPAQ